jgi:hypothetical protein
MATSLLPGPNIGSPAALKNTIRKAIRGYVGRKAK